MNQESKLKKFWEKRNRIKPRIIDWKDGNWARGRQYHLVFLIRLNKTQNFLNNLRPIQNELKKFPCVKILEDDYLHITIKPIGFLNNRKQYEDSYSDKDVNLLIEKAKDTFSKAPSFDIKLKRLNLFDDCIFIEVKDNGIIENLNKKLLTIPNIQKLSRDYPNFIPHVAIAQFKNDKKFKKMVKAIEKFRDTYFDETRITEVALIKLHLSTGHPKIEPCITFKLQD